MWLFIIIFPSLCCLLCTRHPYLFLGIFQIFDDESEEEPVGDDSDEDPDFEFAAEDHAEDEEEYLAPAPVEDDDDDEEALLRYAAQAHHICYPSHPPFITHCTERSVCF